MVRQYDSLLGSVRELRAAAASLGGSAGELLLDACAAAVRLAYNLQTTIKGNRCWCRSHHEMTSWICVLTAAVHISL